jgi:hypothetical protein
VACNGFISDNTQVVLVQDFFRGMQQELGQQLQHLQEQVGFVYL